MTILSRFCLPGNGSICKGCCNLIKSGGKPRCKKNVYGLEDNGEKCKNFFPAKISFKKLKDFCSAKVEQK